MQFGELENVYCPTGKGYAFMTFKNSSGIDAVQRARFFPFLIMTVFYQAKKIIITFFIKLKKIRPHKVDDRLVDTKRSTPKEFAGIPDMDCRFLLVSDLVPVMT